MTEPKWKKLKANQPERFQRFLAGLRPSDRPTLNFLHLLLPHHPWRYLPSGSTHPDRLLGARKGAGPSRLADEGEPAGTAAPARLHGPAAR